MGRSKRFIGKGEGTSFQLMHRSNTDTAHAKEDQPSNYVLVPKKRAAATGTVSKLYLNT